MYYGMPPFGGSKFIDFQKYLPPSFNNIFQDHTRAVGENGGGGGGQIMTMAYPEAGGGRPAPDDNMTPGIWREGNGGSGPKPGPGMLTTMAVGEEGGGGTQLPDFGNIDGPKGATQAVGENGGGKIDSPPATVGAPDPWDDTGSGVATTMAIPENGGGRTPQEQTPDSLGPKLQRRVDKHRERLHSRDLKMHDRLQKMESKGRSQEHIEGRIRRFNDRTNDIRTKFDLDMRDHVGYQSPRSGQEQAAKDQFLQNYQASASAKAKLEEFQNSQTTTMKHAPPRINKPKADGTGGLHTDKKWSQLSKSERKEVKAIHGDNAKNSFQDQRAKSMGYKNEQDKKDDFALKRKVAAGEATHAETRAAGMGSNQQRRAAKRAEREEKRAKRAKAQKFKDDKVKKITGNPQ